MGVLEITPSCQIQPLFCIEVETSAEKSGPCVRLPALASRPQLLSAGTLRPGAGVNCPQGAAGAAGPANGPGSGNTALAAVACVREAPSLDLEPSFGLKDFPPL